MENVPRVAGILEKEVFEESGTLRNYAHLFDDNRQNIRVYNCGDYGVPQNRKRMIAGNFNHDLLKSYSQDIPVINLGDVLRVLENVQGPIEDPNYDLRVQEITDNEREVVLNPEEERLNRDSKTYHHIYNRMAFPENLDRPSRTVTATCTRVSRESIIVQEGAIGYRRLTVRERGFIQTFPINYEFFSNSYGGKLKMIGNAIPPVMAYYIACAMQNQEAPTIHNLIPNVHENNGRFAEVHAPPAIGANFNPNRRFVSAIPNLRFGSGVRFELNNRNYLLDRSPWEVQFFYGTSTNIRSLQLEGEIITIMEDEIDHNLLDECRTHITRLMNGVDIDTLQNNCVHRNEGFGPFMLVDELGFYAERLITQIENKGLDTLRLVREILTIQSRKLDSHSTEIIAGVIIGGLYNEFCRNNFLLGELVDD